MKKETVMIEKVVRKTPCEWVTRCSHRYCDQCPGNNEPMVMRLEEAIMWWREQPGITVLTR